MDATHIALGALVISAGSFCVAFCAFAVQLRRYFDEGVRLSLSIMVGAKIIGGGVVDPNKYLSVTVLNRGSAPTTITHMIFTITRAIWLGAYRFGLAGGSKGFGL